jgi:hypothetical protein
MDRRDHEAQVSLCLLSEEHPDRKAMRIVFNLHNVGLANNGGSRTLIKSGEALALLGHEVIMSSNVDSRYTWHSPRNVRILKSKQPPSADLAIATGYKSVDSTVRQSAKHKAYYIRGYELWQAKEEPLVESFRKLPCIVNSEWLQVQLSSKGVDSTIVYPGVDFDLFSNLEKPRTNQVGGLFHKRHKTKRHEDIEAICNLLGIPPRLVNRHLVDAGPSKMRDFYNSCRVWIAPTESEGLHNCPIEASLCGCCLVATDHPRSGMSDYAIHNETALLYPARNIEAGAECVRRYLGDKSLRLRMNSNMIELLRSKLGTREENMKRFVEVTTS